jgi:hypothetical protein
MIISVVLEDFGVVLITPDEDLAISLQPIPQQVNLVLKVHIRLEIG